MELKLLLADDHSVVRNGISIILKSAVKGLEVRHAQNFAEALSVLESYKANVIFLDINIPGGNSTAMIQSVRKVHPDIYIMMFLAFDEAQYGLRYVHRGANGFLSKDASEEEIIHAFNTILNTGRYISDTLKQKILENALLDIPVNPVQSLSGREMEIAGLLASGNGNLEIANLLNIKMSTVSTYKTRIFEKLNINNVVSLAEMLRVYQG